MAYKDLKLSDLQTKFGIAHQRAQLFDTITPIAPSVWLQQALEKSKLFPIKSEKAKSEFIVAPILADIQERNQNTISIYSGEILNADKKLGLIGECDFILSKEPKSFDIKAPLISVIEAKKGDIELGIHQCAAQLVGLQKFNEKAKHPFKRVYGCVTNTDTWKFLKLEGSLITIDIESYYLDNLPHILGIFQLMIDAS